MQPKMCSKCKKNIAVVFITKVENGVTMNEGYCLKCARSLGIPQIDQAVKQMGISDEDLDRQPDRHVSAAEPAFRQYPRAPAPSFQKGRRRAEGKEKVQAA